MSNHFGSLPCPLSEDEKKYIRDNCHNTTVREFMKEMKRGQKTIYDFMLDNNITPKRKGFGREWDPEKKRSQKNSFKVEMMTSEGGWLI